MDEVSGVVTSAQLCGAPVNPECGEGFAREGFLVESEDDVLVEPSESVAQGRGDGVEDLDQLLVGFFWGIGGCDGFENDFCEAESAVVSDGAEVIESADEVFWSVCGIEDVVDGLSESLFVALHGVEGVFHASGAIVLEEDF